jgi:Fe-S oxidoreductase
MEYNRVRSICCGGGGNLEAADGALSGAMARKKIDEIQATGADTVVTACQQCVRTIKSQVRRQKIDLEVKDLTEFVAQALQRHEDGN